MDLRGVAAGGGACILRLPERGSVRGCSSVVERHVANVNVEGSSPFTRFHSIALGPTHLWP